MKTASMLENPSSAPFVEPLVVDVAIIGGGPAGLMAAEVLALAGREVHLFDAMPSVGRKFLLAGRGGLNLTHSEARPAFDARYGPQSAWVSSWLDGFDGTKCGPGPMHWGHTLLWVHPGGCFHMK